MKYQNKDYVARNLLVTYLEGILDDDSLAYRQMIAQYLAEWEDYIKNAPKFIKEIFAELTKIEKYKGKKQMKILHMTREEVKQLYKKLTGVKIGFQ